MRKPKILPFFYVFIVMIGLSFCLRTIEIAVGVSHLNGVAFAEEQEQPEQEEMTEQEEGDVQNAEEAEVPDVDEPSIEVDEPLWQDAGDADFQNAAVQIELLQDLKQRRQQLDERETELIAREALMQATEKEIDRKYEEMLALRNEIEALLDRQSQEEQERIASLVKVYETMKPKDAARIFDTLDIDVLVSVMAEMSERRLSPILASMNPERARTVTIILAEQKQLPTLPQ